MNGFNVAMFSKQQFSHRKKKYIYEWYNVTYWFINTDYLLSLN